MDDASQAILSFDYDSGPAVGVTIDTKGCETISNDAGVKRLGLDAPVVNQIEALAGPVDMQWAAVSGQVRLTTPVGSAFAVNASGAWVALAQIHRHRFHFLVASPGTYTIRLMGTGGAVNTTVATLTTSVSVGRTTHVTFTNADLRR
jgi:hypothetical protein